MTTHVSLCCVNQLSVNMHDQGGTGSAKLGEPLKHSKSPPRRITKLTAPNPKSQQLSQLNAEP